MNLFQPVQQRVLFQLIQDQGLAGVVNTTHATPDALSKVDWARASSYMFMQFIAWECVCCQDNDGSIPTRLRVGTEAYPKELIATKPGYSRFWPEFADQFDEPFRSYVSADFARRVTA